jgi:SWI/SNF-related matrix-associated actin-dependent regulator of chromatin subfamily A3
MGQTRPVTAIKLMINNSIELKLDEIQRKKANLAQLSLKNMTRKELMRARRVGLQLTVLQAEELASLFR